MLKFSRPLSVLVLTVATAASLTACGSGDAKSDGPPPASGAPSVSVSHTPEKAKVNKGAVTKQLKPGQHIDLGAIDGYKHLYVRVDSVDARPTCTGTLPDPTYGRYAAVTITMQGIRSKGKPATSPLLIGNWTSTQKSGDQFQADWSQTMTCLDSDSMLRTTLGSGDIAHGTLVFDVPDDTTKLTEQFTYAKPATNIEMVVPALKK